MKWKYFWIGCAFFYGGYRIREVSNFAKIPLESNLNFVTALDMTLSGLFILGFILEKIGAIDMLIDCLQPNQ